MILTKCTSTDNGSSFQSECFLIDIFRMKSCIDERQTPGIQISSIQCLQEPLQMGQLSGNHFMIVIRDVVLKTDDTYSDGGVEMLTKVEDEVEKAVKNIKVLQSEIPQILIDTFWCQSSKRYRGFILKCTKC